jgi:PAB-dependent poly(A)-specific ribonuclease subunit 2
VLYYQRIDADSLLDLSRLPQDVDPAILHADLSISRRRDLAGIKHTPLSPAELPRPGSLVSIDAEFVSLQDEEVEYRSNGPRKVIRPKRMSLARVSVLRGEGESTGLPFIDDYINTSEPIVDYLTEFSGIRGAPLPEPW